MKCDAMLKCPEHETRCSFCFIKKITKPGVHFIKNHRESLIESNQTFAILP
jgi:hypothetical protein